jgi:hypothetical protein
MLIEEHDLAFLADGTDEMHLARRERQFRRRSKTGWQRTSRAERVHFLWRAALQGRVVSAVTISVKEERRMLPHSRQVGQIDLVPDIVGVVLMKAFDTAIAFRMANGRKDQLGSDHQP